MVVRNKDFYKAYHKENFNTKYDLTEQKYKEVLQAITDNILTTLESGDFVEMPYNLGSFKILKFKNRSRYIDWKNTKLLGKYVYFNNLHSDGYSYKFKLDKTRCKFGGQKYYGFKVARYFARGLAKGIKENKLEFLSE